MQRKRTKKNQWAFCQWKRFMIIPYCTSSMTAIAWHLQSGQTDFNDVVTKVSLSGWTFRSYASISFPQEVRGRFLDANFSDWTTTCFLTWSKSTFDSLKGYYRYYFMLMCLYNNFPSAKFIWIKKKNTGDKNMNLISVVSIKKIDILNPDSLIDSLNPENLGFC